MVDQGNYGEKVQKCREELDRIQTELDGDPFNEEIQSVEGIYLQAFIKAREEEESYLKQRDKVQWLKEGDCNSAYFHKVVKGKINRHGIETIMDGDGNWWEGDETNKNC